MVRIPLRRQGDIFDKALCCLLIFFKLLHGCRRNGLRRLRSLVLHVQERSLKMNAQDFRSFVALLHHGCHIGHGLGEHIRHLGYGSGQDGCYTLLRYPLHPVAESLRPAVVCIKIICSVCVDVNETRHDSLIPVILIRRSRTIPMDTADDPILNLHLGCHELSCYPDSLTLNPHNFFSFHLICSLY